MNIIFHADDLGLSKGITDNILYCFDHGILSGASIMPTGHAYEYAVEEHRKRPGLELTCHLNFYEGRAISPQDKINLLVDGKGNFYHSFISLWKTYLMSSLKKRTLLINQIRAEISAQIDKFRDSFPNIKTLKIDSHQHMHMIPFVFNSIIDLHNKYDIDNIRIPYEPFFLHLDGMQSIKCYAGPNILKHVLLNTLSKIQRHILEKLNIGSCDYFIGILFAGKMTESVVRSAITKLSSVSEPAIVEILFHPGGAVTGEEELWDDNIIAKNYYYSDWRQSEKKSLSGDYIKIIIKKAMLK